MNFTSILNGVYFYFDGVRMNASIEAACVIQEAVRLKTIHGGFWYKDDLSSVWITKETTRDFRADPGFTRPTIPTISSALWEELIDHFEFCRAEDLSPVILLDENGVTFLDDEIEPITSLG